MTVVAVEVGLVIVVAVEAQEDVELLEDVVGTVVAGEDFHSRSIASTATNNLF